jgi:hypothetical protein
MRKSKLSARSRALRAGITVGAVAAALLVAPQAAFAVISTSPSGIIAPGDAVTITDSNTGSNTPGSGTPFSASNASKVELVTGVTTCPAKYSATSSTVIAVASNTSSTTQVTFTWPTTATAASNGQVKRWLACVYEGATASTSNLQGVATGYPFYVGVAPTASPTTGVSGGGNTVTVTGGTGGAIFNGVTAPSAIFTTSECPSTYGTPAANTAVAGTKTSDSVAGFTVPSTVLNSSVGPTGYNVCLYNGATSSSALISWAPYNVSLLTLSQSTGSFVGGNGLNVTSPVDFLAGVDNPGVVFKNGTCPTTYTETGDAATKPVSTANVRKLSNGRLAMTVPNFFANSTAFLDASTGHPSGTGTWRLCLYNGQDIGSSTPLYSTSYSITTVPSATRVTPNAGPALGGRKITVTGVALPTAANSNLTATLGGTPLTDIEVINSTAFTATTPMHAPANNVALVLSTPAGSSTLSNAYSYTSSLIATPNTAPNTRAVDVIVNGVGFQSPAWNSGRGGAHIYLVKGRYAPSDAGGSKPANPGVAECSNVLPLSDTELVCTLALNRRLNVNGTTSSTTPRTVTMATTLGTRVVTVSSGTVSRDDIGMLVANMAALPAGTTIVDVLDPTHFIASSSPSATDAGDATSDITMPVLRTGLSVGGMANNGTTVTAASGVFTSADVGRWISGTDIAVGTYITDWSTSGGTDTITLSAALPSSVAGASASDIQVSSNVLPVPEGAYNLTYVSNGNLGASISDPAYIQSVISSASTFTVSPF